MEPGRNNTNRAQTRAIRQKIYMPNQDVSCVSRTPWTWWLCILRQRSQTCGVHKIKGLSDHKQILLNKCLCLCLGTTARPIGRANQPLNAATTVTTRQFVTHQTQPAHGVALTTNQTGEGLSPVVITEVNRFKCRALTNSEAGSLYVLAKLIKLLRTKPTDVQTKAIDMLMSSKNC